MRLPSLLLSFLLSTGLAGGLKGELKQLAKSYKQGADIEAELVALMEANEEVTTEEAEATPTPTPDATATPSPTLSPSPEPSPTATPTATPTPSPEPDEVEDEDDEPSLTFKNFGQMVSFFRNNGQRSEEVHEYKLERRQELEEDEEEKGMKVGHAEELKVKNIFKFKVEKE